MREMREMREMFEKAWSAETSNAPDWSPERPSRGQCAITALIVQDGTGGDLVRVINAGDSHYFNRLPDGSEVDLTRDQFDEWDPSPAEIRTRAYVLSHPDTASRYEMLREQMSRKPS